MPIIFAMFTEPVEQVMQGEQFHFMPTLTVDNSHATLFPDAPMILENPIEQMNGSPVPAQIDSWLPEWGWSNKLTKTSNNSGDMVLIPLAIQPATSSLTAINASYMAASPIPLQTTFQPMNTNPWTDPNKQWQQIDPIQQFLMTNVPIDVNGNWIDADVDLAGAPEASSADEFEYMAAASTDPALTDVTLPFVNGTTLPRAEILLSRGGLGTRWWGESLPNVNWGRRMMKVYRQTTIKQLITGVTRNSSGVALGNCTVYAFRTDKFVFNNDPNSGAFVASTVSDGGGNFSIQVMGNAKYQLTAYLTGAPDVAGITVTNITATQD